MPLAYFDCFSGVSGDMTLGALVHLGVPVAWLKDQLQSLPLDGFDITGQTVMRNGIEAVQVTVHAEETHHHRNHRHIQAMIEKSPLSEGVKEKSLAVFDCLAEAEAKIHGCTKETVHFHEVGGIDAIVDIVGTCLGMEWLGISRVAASSLPLGHGFVTCAHGVLPVPAPAVMEILKDAPVYGGDVEGELVTPTGAAILTGTKAVFGDMPAVKILQTGYGAGTRQYENRPNLLRVVLGEPLQLHSSHTKEKLAMVETCIDDMNPEIFSYLMDVLFADGALDVFWVPVQMKKNRPGTLVKVLCPLACRTAVVQRLFSETTTLGVRHYEVGRTVLTREALTVESALGPVQVKRVQGPDGGVRMVPEYEVCRRIAREKKMPLQQVYDAILKTAALSD